MSAREQRGRNESMLEEAELHGFVRDFDRNLILQARDACKHARRAAVDFVHLYAGRDKRRQRVAKLTIGARHVRK